MKRSKAAELLSGLRDCDETQGGVLRALRAIVEELAEPPCPGCNDDGVLHDGEGLAIGPCSCVEVRNGV